MSAALYSHQIAGAEFLAPRTRAYLADAPRVGKTLTTLTALELAGISRALVVCPAIVRDQWWQQARESRYSGFLHVESYDAIVRGGDDLAAYHRERGVQALVLDEAHYLKTPTALRTKALLGAGGYASWIPVVWALSGTPIPKNPAELWPVLFSLFPKYLVDIGIKNRRNFLDRYCDVVSINVRGKWVEKVKPTIRNAVEFKQLLDRFMLRRTLDDIGMDVPQLWWQVTDIAPKEWHDDAKRAAAEQESELETVRRSARQVVGLAKADSVAALLCQQLEDNPTEKVVVLAYHRSVLAGLRQVLDHFGVAYVDGSTPPPARSAQVAFFQNEPDFRVFLGQQQACMTGIPLHAANRVVLVEPSWTAMENVQAANRVVSIGKTARCTVEMVALAGTVDTAIVRQHWKEAKLASTIFTNETQPAELEDDFSFA